MKKLWILLLMCALLLSGCKKDPEFAAGGTEPVVSTPSKQEDVSPPGSEGPSEPQTEQSDPPPAPAPAPSEEALQVEASVTEVKENGVIMGVNGRGLLSKIFVRTDVQTEAPLPELRKGYRVQLQLKEAIPEGVLPTVVPKSILFLEDLGEYGSLPSEYPEDYFEESLSAPQNEIYASEVLKDGWIVSWLEQTKQREDTVFRIKSRTELERLLEKAGAAHYSSAGLDMSIYEEYDSAFFRKNDLLITGIQGNNGGDSFRLYDVLIDEKTVTLQLGRSNAPYGYGVTDNCPPYTMLVVLPKTESVDCSEYRLQTVYLDECRVAAKEAGKLYVACGQYSIQDSFDSPAHNSKIKTYYYCFETENAENVSLDQPLILAHTGMFEEGMIAKGELIAIHS